MVDNNALATCLGHRVIDLLDGHGHQAWITEHLDGREDKYSKVEESF
jgi:hypothetical protein